MGGREKEPWTIDSASGEQLTKKEEVDEMGRS
jgi:hypothetical protein